METEHVLELAVGVREAVGRMVKDARGIRVEDYLTVLAAATGEAALIDSGCIDIEAGDLVAGQAVFGDEINHALSGDTVGLFEADPMSVVGVLRDELVPDPIDVGDFGSIERIYAHVASQVGGAEWGHVPTTVPEGNRPRVHPLKSAFELRPAVDAAMSAAGLPTERVEFDEPLGWGRRVVCAMALASAIAQTKAALEPRIAMTLSLEVTFGMAKTVPMSSVAMKRAMRGGITRS